MSIAHSEFTDQVKRWNKDVYGHIFTCKKLLTRKLQSIEIERDRRNSDYLNQVEMEVRGELENMLHHEVLLWHQKFDESLPPNAFLCLTDEDFNLLNNPVSDEKIKAALFDIAHLKAIRSDAHEHTDFLARRNITNNIVIAQEVIHSMRSMQKNRRWMTIKIDLKKAYDRMRWDFIDFYYAVLLNGVPTLKFWPARSIRQGCLLYRYLFIFCMEWLAQSIRITIDAGNWNPIRLARNGLLLSHLFFVGDFILFGHADGHQAQDYQDVLHVFRDCSAARIIWDKFIPEERLSEFYNGSLHN
ncbi:uncharacterized protein LOC108472231 [Gossypium arboreum]|uniref:uncharacterized protein LOC108472231 n=1 Tax=Gossypium arboreum TaxID=29729 RepID=UPI00081953B7|nr:uncharacterized protein LOC108472231 [Gossypium arboreum]